MKRLLYSLLVGVIVYLGAAALLIALNSVNIFSNPLTLQGIFVVAAAIAAAGYAYWRLLSTV